MEFRLLTHARDIEEAVRSLPSSPGSPDRQIGPPTGAIDAIPPALMVALDGDTIVGALSLYCQADGRFSDFQRHVFQLARFEHLVQPRQMAIATDLYIRDQHSYRDMLQTLLAAAWDYLRLRDVKLCFTDGAPERLQFFQELGLRSYGEPFNHTSGLSVPLVISTVQWHRQRQGRDTASTLTGADLAVAHGLRDVLGLSNPVTCSRLSPDAYRTSIDGLAARQGQPSIPAFRGFSGRQLQRVLAGGYILECSRGVTLMSRAHKTRTIYIVLEGQLLARQYGSGLALHQGDICGEIAFVMDHRDPAEVRVISERARVLCLDRAVLREVAEEQPVLASRLLSNLTQVVNSQNQLGPMNRRLAS